MDGLMAYSLAKKAVNKTLNSLNARIDNLAAMADAGEIPAGTIESEVIDARGGYDSGDYNSLHDAIAAAMGTSGTGGATEEQLAQIEQNEQDISSLSEELADIRVGADGTVYDSAGTAVREQIGAVMRVIDAYGDSPIKTGTQKFNKDNATVGRYSYNTGDYVYDASYCTSNFIYCKDAGTIWVNRICHIAFYDKYRRYISGAVNAETKWYSVTVPENAVWVIVSVQIVNKSQFIVNFGDTHYTDVTYYLQIPNLRYSEKKDYSTYALPYIKNGKCCCNKVTDSTTACYAGVDCGEKVNQIYANFVWEDATDKPNGGGTVALVLNPNGVRKISDITNLSVHLILKPNLLKVDILGNKFGSYYYQNLINQEVSLSTGEENEHSVYMFCKLASGICSVSLDGVEYTGNFVATDDIQSLSDVVGNYATFQHYCSGNMDDYAMPEFTYFAVKNVSGALIVRDYFDREDSQLQNAPTGQPYHLINNGKYAN